MLTCPWCGTHSTSFHPNCQNCGGPLPRPPGEDPGPPPPEAPRHLPPQFVRRVRYTKNVLFIVGVVFVGVAVLVDVPLLVFGLLGSILALTLVGSIQLVVFGVLGSVLATVGHRKAMATLRAFEVGRATLGTIRRVYYDSSVRINNRSPVAIEYTFEAGGLACQGKAQTWDDTALERRPGQSLHVLYVEEDPEQNTIWPPVK